MFTLTPHHSSSHAPPSLGLPYASPPPSRRGRGGGDMGSHNGGGGGAGEPVSLEEIGRKRQRDMAVDREEEEEEEITDPTRPTTTCPLCLIGFKPPTEREADPQLARVWGVFANNIRHVSQTELFHLVSRTYHKQYIQYFTNAGLKSPHPPCSALQVAEHIQGGADGKGHMIYPEFEIADDIRTLKSLRVFLEDCVGEEDEKTGKVKPNKEAIDLLLKTIDKKQQVMMRTYGKPT